MRPVGWRYESHRHALAARGVKTNRAYLMSTWKSLPQYQILEIKKWKGAAAAEEARRLAIERHLSAKELAEHFGVEYVRKMKNQPTSERAYQGYEQVVPRLEGGVVVVPEVSSEERMLAVMRGEGYAELTKQQETIDTQLELAKRREEGVAFDIVTADKAQQAFQVEYLKRRLEAAKLDREALERQQEILKEIGQSGEVEKVLTEAQKASVLDKVLLAPKREAAILEAKENPVVAELPVEWRVPILKKPVVPPEGELQTRITKFMAGKEHAWWKTSKREKLNEYLKRNLDGGEKHGLEKFEHGAVQMAKHPMKDLDGEWKEYTSLTDNKVYGPYGHAEPLAKKHSMERWMQRGAALFGRVASQANVEPIIDAKQDRSFREIMLDIEFGRRM